MWLIAQGQVHVAVRKLLAAYGDEVGSITATGHSLGGALATLCAFDLVCFETIFPRVTHTLYVLEATRHRSGGRA